MSNTGASLLVVGLDHESALAPEVAGRKAATLARLVRLGLPVPPGAVVTTAACERILSDSGLDPAASQEEIAGTLSIPEDLFGVILEQVGRFGDRPLAVRSSGVAEDLADASFAGQYETVLGVRTAEEIAGAIKTCLAALFSERVRAYAGTSDEPPKLALLIQPLVAADAAGVAFTANPVTGDGEVVINAVKGLGDRLVSGEATPDEWIVREGEILLARVEERSITEDQVLAIAALAKKIEGILGDAQDIEWALTGVEVQLLQARPITALPVAPDIDVPSAGFWAKDDTHYPMPLTPFGASVYLPSLERAMSVMGETFGMLIEGNEQRSFGGEVYSRMIPVGGKERAAPPWWVIWLAARVIPAFRERARQAEVAVSSRVWDGLIQRWESEWRTSFMDEAQELRGVDLGRLSDQGLLDHLDRVIALLNRGEHVHFLLAGANVIPLYELALFLEQYLGWDRKEVISLVSGFSETSSRPGRELTELARLVASSPSAAQIVTEGGDDVVERLREVDPATADSFAAYLDAWGHRTASYDPGSDTLFEHPALVARLVTDRISDDEAVAERKDEPAVLRARSALRELSADLGDRFEDLLAAARRAYGVREDNVFYVDGQPSALIHYAALEIGRRLTSRGKIRRPGDAMYLEERELRGALTNGVGDLAPVIGRRKAERAWVATHPGPPSYGKDPGRPPDLRGLPDAARFMNSAAFFWMDMLFPKDLPDPESADLVGIPGSPGRYTGPVRVIREESQFETLRPGDVLVCPITSPAWSVLFGQARAVVTDGGGVLAHSAVIAREYGIPAVLATKNATRKLRDGVVVTVDGTAGVVVVEK